MSEFSLSDLQEIVRASLGDASIVLDADGTSSSVPGWDSLQHTLIILDINKCQGINLEPGTAAQAKTFGELVDLINRCAG